MRKTILSFLVFALALASTVGYANSSYAPTSKPFTRLSQLPNIGKNPVYATRGLLLDNARKNYPLPWIKKLVTYMSKLELNQIQLHFSDIEAVRIQSKKHPEINSNPQLSQNDLKNLLKFAKSKKVNIVPDMDIPGHMGRILKNHPEFQLPSSSGIKFPATLNIMDEKAVQFALSIVDEYMNLFPDSKYIGLGFDEIFAIIGDKVLDFSNMDIEAKKRFGPNADRNDLVVDLANRFTKHVLSKGKIPYVWNDGVSESKVVKLDKRAVIRYWTHSDKTLLKPNYWFNNGYEVVNFNENALYYVPGIAKLPLAVQNTLQPVATLQTVHKWYPLWFPAMDYSVRPFIPQKITPKEAGNKLLGSMLSLWGNFPDLFTPDEAFDTLKYLLAEFAIRNWNPTYKHDLKLTQKLVKNFS